MNVPMKLSLKSMGLNTPRGLVLLSLLALLALFGAGVGLSHSALAQVGTQIAATNGTIHVGGQAAANGDIHVNTLAATTGDIRIGSGG